MSNPEVVICNPVRTAIGTYGGTLKSIPATELGATVIRECLKRAGLAPDKVDTVVMGHVVQAGAKMNPARQAAIGAGVPVSAPAMTVNRVCGSGAQAVVSAALEVIARQRALRGCGRDGKHGYGALSHGGRAWGYRMGDAQIYDSMLRDGLNDAFSGEHSGWHTEKLLRVRHYPGEAGWLGATLAGAFRRCAGGRKVRARDCCGRSERQERPGNVREG